jgi:hypothetical protein
MTVFSYDVLKFLKNLPSSFHSRREVISGRSGNDLSLPSLIRAKTVFFLVFLCCLCCLRAFCRNLNSIAY